MLNYFPKYFTSKAMSLYIGVLVLCNVVFFNHFLSPLWWVFGLVEVLSFFYFSNQLTRKWANYSEKKFIKKLFLTGLAIRLVWVIFSYYFYTYMTGKPFDLGAADVFNYHNTAIGLAKAGLANLKGVMVGTGPSDQGYIIYLSRIYLVFGNGVLIPRLLKALYGGYMSVLIYKFATRNFGEEVGRMSAIFCMIMPNLIYYTGSHLKEAEMVFLSVAFMERADYLIRSKKYNIINIAAPLLLAGALFYLRTVLGATALFALFSALIFSSTRVLGMGKRTILIVWMLAAGGYFVGGKIATEIEAVWQQRDTNQQTSMNWRAKRKGGNEFAKYAGGAVFAPMIFVIPFPTIIETPGQQTMKLLNGGNYVKNIMGFFVILAFYWVIKEKKWRDYVLIGSFTIGYLVVLALSAFAQSERFHQPVLPFELIIAAFGISIVTNKQKKYFTQWMILIFVIIIAWSWFKLAGRGLA